MFRYRVKSWGSGPCVLLRSPGGWSSGVKVMVGGPVSPVSVSIKSLVNAVGMFGSVLYTVYSLRLSPSTKNAPNSSAVV